MSHAFNWASFRSASKCGTASPIKSDLMLKFLLERVRVQDLLGDAPLHHFVGNAMTAAAENGNFAAFTHLRSRFPNVRINDEMFHAAIESLDYDLVSFMRSIDSVNWLGDEEIDVCELAITSYRGRRGLETVKLCCRDVEGKDISQDSFILSFDLIRIGSLDHRPNIALFDFLHREKGVIFDEKLLEHAAKNGLASLVRHVIDELGLVPSHQLLDVVKRVWISKWVRQCLIVLCFIIFQIAIRSARRDKYQRKGLHVDFKQTLIELKNNIRL